VFYFFEAQFGHGSLQGENGSYSSHYIIFPSG
jgi:hypothetical protein